MSDTTMDPKAIAQAVAVTVSDEDGQVGDFVEAIDLGDNVTDFRFESRVRGYEAGNGRSRYTMMSNWTIGRSTNHLVPTDKALRPPKWIPWKDRLEPGDLAVTDSIGTDPDDPRMEEASARRRMPKHRTIRTTNRQSRMKPYRNRRWMETLRMSLRRRTFRRIPNSL